MQQKTIFFPVRNANDMPVMVGILTYGNGRCMILDFIVSLVKCDVSIGPSKTIMFSKGVSNFGLECHLLSAPVVTLHLHIVCQRRGNVL